LGKYYIWFVVVVAGLAGVIRVALPRRFAEMQLARLQKHPISRERARGLLFLAMGLIFGIVYFRPWGHEVWVAIGVIFSLLSAGECFLQIRFRSLDALIFQSRLLGILYLGLAAGSYVMLRRA
jgi:DMSO reductase anchor subunit